MAYICWAELAAAVSNAGGLGSIGPNAGSGEPARDVAEVGQRLRDQIRRVKTLTDKPFAVNFPMYEGVSAQFPGNSPQQFTEECVRVAIEEKIPVAITCVGRPDMYVGRFKQAGVKVLHRAMPSNVEAAKQAERTGVDAFVATGYESGGHSGIDRIPTLVLIPQIVDAVNIPVVAGGGIADGRGFVAALALGAEGIYMGTRFIATPECSAHPRVKQAILDATDTSTVSWIGMTGVVRNLRNKLAERCLEMESKGATADELTRFYGGARLRVGLVEGDIIEGDVPLGSVAGMIKGIVSAGEIVTRIVEEADKLMRISR